MKTTVPSAGQCGHGAKFTGGMGVVGGCGCHFRQLEREGSSSVLPPHPGQSGAGCLRNRLEEAATGASYGAAERDHPREGAALPALLSFLQSQLRGDNFQMRKCDRNVRIWTITQDLEFTSFRGEMQTLSLPSRNSHIGEAG